MGQLPGLVYAREGERVYVSLFIGSEAELDLPGGAVRITQETAHPWDGTVRLTVDPVGAGEEAAGEAADFDLFIRIPGWARDEPVPSGLYAFADDSGATPALRLNGDTVPLDVQHGFAVLDRTWRTGDTIELELPMPVRRVAAHPSVENNSGRLAIQRGPLVYAVEAVDNGGTARDIVLAADAPLTTEHRPEMLGGVTVIRGPAARGGSSFELLAVPYFAWANREPGEMAVWLPTD